MQNRRYAFGDPLFCRMKWRIFFIIVSDKMNRRKFIQHSGLALLGSALASKKSFSSYSGKLPAAEPDQLIDSIVSAALDAGAQYADVRLVNLKRQKIQVQNNIVSAISEMESFGYGLRVFAGGNFGFASFDNLEKQDVSLLVRHAIDTARSRGSIQPLHVDFKSESINDTWRTPVKTDPFSVTMKEKIDFLKSLTAAGLAGEHIEFAVANFFFIKEEKIFVSSTGKRIQQTLFKTYPNFAVTAVDKKNGIMESCSSFFEPQAVGYEITTSYPFIDELKQACADAYEKALAQPQPAGSYDLIITPSHLWSLFDETLGYHLDPANVFLLNGNNPNERLYDPSEIGNALIASDKISVQADNTLTNALASSKYDDEGNRSSVCSIIENGRLHALPVNKELQNITSLQSEFACSTAEDWNFPAISRQPNLILKAQEHGATLDQIISRTEKGILLKGRGNIYHNYDRKSFQAVPQLMWLVENGKIVRMIRNTSYQARTLDFWKSCTELGGEQDLQMGGTIFQDAGDPPQQGGHSVIAPVAVFHNVQLIPLSK